MTFTQRSLLYSLELYVQALRIQPNEYMYDIYCGAQSIYRVGGIQGCLQLSERTNKCCESLAVYRAGRVAV